MDGITLGWLGLHWDGWMDWTDWMTELDQTGLDWNGWTKLDWTVTCRPQNCFEWSPAYGGPV